MEVRLVQLLASFIRVSADYSLARLELAMARPDLPAPPLLDRLPDASEASLRMSWPTVESQLEAARAFAKQLVPASGNQDRDRDAAAWLVRTLQELDQYARAIRWVLTVTEKES